MDKIDNNENQQTQQYTTEIQPQNNNSNGGNNSTANIYTDGTKTSASTSSSGSSGSDSISKIQKQVTNQGIEYAGGLIGAGATAGICAIAAGIYKGKALAEGI